MSAPPEPSSTSAWQPALSLWDVASLTVGIVVGTSVFVMPPLILSLAGSPLMFLALWIAGGGLSLLGGLVFAEMAVRFPRGGAYAYLTAAFGPTAGLLYGVSSLTIILTAATGAMAFTFAQYAQRLTTQPLNEALLAAGVVAALAVFNAWNQRSGSRIQNLLTAAKIVGLGGIVLAGLLGARSVAAPPAMANPAPELGIALVLVLYAYGGWSDAAAVAAEVKNRQRNIPLALAGGLAAVTIVYVVVNAAYLALLGGHGLRTSSAPAQDALSAALGPAAGRMAGVLVMISALGAVHGMLFSGSRSLAALGEDHPLFRRLAAWAPGRGVPSRAVWTLAAIAGVQIAAVGTTAGRRVIDVALTRVGLGSLPWEQFNGGFATLVAASAPIFWVFMLATGAAFFKLRAAGLTPGEFVCPGSPAVPLAYCATCLFLLWNSVNYAGLLGLLGLVPCLAVLALSWRGRAEIGRGGRSLEDSDPSLTAPDGHSGRGASQR